jgi:hypothetical protein
MRRLPLVLALLPALAAPAGAADGLTTEWIALEPWSPPPLVAGPGLWCVSDPQVRDGGFPGSETAWDAETPFHLFEFGEPPSPLPIDTVRDVVVRAVPEFESREGFNVDTADRRLVVRADAATHERVRAAAETARRWLAPLLHVSATLSADEGSASRLVAAGGARLLPRRWTRVWRQQHDRRYPLGWDIEIAQEVTAQDPVVVGVPEGTELYLRWTPGESVSVVEAWAGVLDHLEGASVDLSGIRNVPEANAYGRALFPRTAVRRAFPAFAVPSDRPSSHEVAWDGPGGARVLRLSFAASPASPPPIPVGDQGRVFGLLRTGAATASLAAESRAPTTDAWISNTRDAMPGAEASLDSWGEAFVAVEAPSAAFAAIRQRLVETERALRGASVEVRAVAVAEADLRRLLESGEAVVGAPLSPQAEEALLGASSPVARVRLPVTPGVPAGLRAGEAEVVLDEIEVEVAQQAGGIDPVSRGIFAGLAGVVRLSAGEGAAGLELDATMGWRARDSKVELAFRPPVGMQFNREGVKAEDPAVRRVPLPFGSRGGAHLQARAGWSSADAGRPALLAVVFRQGTETLPEAVVVFGSVSR